MRQVKFMEKALGFFLTLLFIQRMILFPIATEETGTRTYKTDIFAEKVMQMPSTEQTIAVDGQLTEDCWKDALKIPLNYEISPGENTPPPVKTDCYLAYGRDHIYVGFVCQDPNPSEIRAHLSDRDNSWNDDHVGFIIDTFNDENRGYFFGVNALGVQNDSILSEGGTREDISWDAIWHAASQRNPQGYTVEVAIPFHAIQFQRKLARKTWGFVAIREYPRSKRHQILNSPIDRSNSCLLCQIWKVQGMKGKPPDKTFELDPTVMAYRSAHRSDFPEGELENQDPEGSVGFSGKWSFSPNLSLGFAINPDFSHVEADVAQFEINTQFALYYPEKRPFFLEGNDFFKTRIETVYTRAIVDPDWGLKMSGKSGNSAVGVFVARDNITNLILPGIDRSISTSLQQPAWATVMRYRYDFGNSSAVGVLLTDREGDDYSNRVGGIDGLLRITPNDTLRFQYLVSSTRYPESIVDAFKQKNETFWGKAFEVHYQHRVRNWLWEIGYDDFNPDFRADLGFVPQVDQRRLSGGGGYIHWGKKGDFFSSVEVRANFDQTWDYLGNVVEREMDMVLCLNGPLQSRLISTSGVRRYEYNGVEFDQFSQYLSLQLRPTGSLFLNLECMVGDSIDLYHTREGTVYLVTPAITFNLGSNLSISASHSYNALHVEGGRLFKGELSQLKVIIHLNHRAFIRGIVQYKNLSHNLALYSAPIQEEDKNLFTQFLFSYKLNPRTVLFLGYSDDYLGSNQLVLTQTRRTVFLKIGYALVI